MYDLRRPARALGPFIENYWAVHSSPEEPVDLRVTVFVDARADLIFNFGAPYLRTVIGGEAREIDGSNVDAQRLYPIRIEQRGAVHTVGVRFRLGGLGAFSRVALSDVTGETPSPVSVLGPDAVELEDALRRASDLDACASLLDHFFLGRLTGAEAHLTFRRALARLEDSDGLVSIGEVARRSGVGARQVARLFSRFLGVAPKRVGRILRFQQALGMLMEDPGCTLAEVSAAAGYFDQAHFIRDFREMSGGVPRGYRGYYPPDGPSDFAPNVVVFVQEPVPGGG